MKEVLFGELARSFRSSDPIRETPVPVVQCQTISTSDSDLKFLLQFWGSWLEYVATLHVDGLQAPRHQASPALCETRCLFGIIRIIRLRPFSNLHANETANGYGCSSCLLLLAFQCCCFRMLGAGFVSAFACPYKMCRTSLARVLGLSACAALSKLVCLDGG